MFLSKLFHRKNKKKWEEDVAKYEQERYAALETEDSERTLHLTEPKNAASYVVDLCEQMIDVSKNIEGIRQEYQMVTSYLTDIQIIEELTEAERAPIEACAQHVSQLEKQRSEFLKIEHKLSDTQYGQMQQEEAEIPGVIRRLSGRRKTAVVYASDGVSADTGHYEKSILYFTGCICGFVCRIFDRFLVFTAGSAAADYNRMFCCSSHWCVYFYQISGSYKKHPQGGCEQKSCDFSGKPCENPVCEYKKCGGLHM